MFSYKNTYQMKGVIFKIPKTIKHKDARKIISSFVRDLNNRGVLSEYDIPNLHRMATAYDSYLSCVDTISRDGMTMTNIKGEEVKRPEMNILKESWSQYLDLAKEYGFTMKSKGQIKALSSSDDEECPMDLLVKEMR